MSDTEPAFVPTAESEMKSVLAAFPGARRALFAAYDGMFADISYALGLAVAQEMRAEDI